jgi:glycine/D-amino acid oxidase-like deaminating enzyme/nitrite reductase/ring-hydroxylating ferredoxin subunit/DMSO/TMAO reductase YedYZ heme-binding membrane subunit
VPKQISPWLETTPDKRRYPTLKGEQDVDIVVVGAGIAGIMTAWHLAEQGAHVALIEKNHIATGDTGYTTAFVTRVPDTPLAALAARHGTNFVKDIFAATSGAQNYLRRLVKTQHIECDWRDCNAYQYSYQLNDAFLQSEWSVVQESDPRASLISGQAATSAAHFISQAIKFEGEARFDVRKFIFGLLKVGVAKNIQVFEESEVVDIELGERVRVKTALGSLSCNKVIVTTGMPAVFTETHLLFRPQITYALVAKYDKAQLSDDIFWDTEQPHYTYTRRVGTDGIMVGGADQETSALDATKAHGKLTAFLEKHFGAPKEITNAWSGSLFYTDDGLPYASPHPGFTNRVFISSGFGGNGMVFGTLAGQLASDWALGRPNTFLRHFSFARTHAKIGAHLKIPAQMSATTPKTTSALHTILKIVLPLIYLAVLALPAWYFFSTRGGIGFLSGASLRTVELLVFPLFGLYAFVLVWAQVMLGSSMPVWRKVFPWIEKFHRAEGVFVLLFALIHPSLLFLAYGPADYLAKTFVTSEQKLFVTLGQFQLLLLVLTVSTALLRNTRLVKRWWRYVHWANYLVFISAWTHSWFLGSDVQTSGLRYVWIFFGITFVISSVARIVRGIKNKRAQKAGAAPSTGQFHKVAELSRLSEGKPFCARIGQRAIALFKQGEQIFAIDNTCTHQGGPLCEGTLTNGIIQCPWHGSRFDIKTGKVVGPPAARDLRQYRVRVRGSAVEVEA